MSKSPAPKKRQLRVANKSTSADLPTASASVSFFQRLGLGRALRPVTRPIAAVGRRVVPAYFRASWRELRMVTWPNFKQTRQLTSAVILFALVFGILIAVFDYGLDKLFKEVIK